MGDCKTFDSPPRPCAPPRTRRTPPRVRDQRDRSTVRRAHTDTPQTRETTHAPHTHTHTYTHTARVMCARQPGAAAGARSILASVEPLPRADSESVSMLEHAGADRPWTYGGAVLCGSDTTRTYGLGPGDGRTPRAGGSTVGHAAGCVQTACSWDLCRVAWRFLRADSPVIRRGVLHCAGRVSGSI